MVEKTPHRSFTVRLPLDRYCEIAEEARQEGVSINLKVSEYLRIGRERTININAKIAELIQEKLLPELQKGSNNAG